MAAGAIAAGAAAAAALAALWPRDFPVLATSRLADYIAAESDFTKRRVADTLEEMLLQASRLLERKGRALKMAFAFLSVALLILATGVVAMGPA